MFPMPMSTFSSNDVISSLADLFEATEVEEYDIREGLIEDVDSFLPSVLLLDRKS